MHFFGVSPSLINIIEKKEEIPSNQQPKTYLELITRSEQNFNEHFKYNDPGTCGHLN